jgi:hypothetical protein
MALYFFHLRDHVDELLDPEGLDLPDLEAVKKTVLRGARDTIAHDIKSDGVLDLRYRIDAENEDGEIVHTLAFKDAFRIIPEG